MGEGHKMCDFTLISSVLSVFSSKNRYQLPGFGTG